MMLKRAFGWTLLLVAQLAVVSVTLSGQTMEEGRGRWTAQRANDWYAKQPWLVGGDGESGTWSKTTAFQ